jgi:hypothetical protein
MREHDWLVGAENSTPRHFRKREYVYMAIALALLLAGPLRNDLESAEITAQVMPPAHPCEVTIAQYGATERWLRKANEHCALWAQEPPPWIMSLPIAEKR